jgi:hypothetical protein
MKVPSLEVIFPRPVQGANPVTAEDSISAPSTTRQRSSLTAAFPVVLSIGQEGAAETDR